MKTEIGDRVIRFSGFDYVVLEVTSRTANTIATRHLNGSTSDHRAPLHNFRSYEKTMVDRIIQLEQDRNDILREQRSLYQSLEKIA